MQDRGFPARRLHNTELLESKVWSDSTFGAMKSTGNGDLDHSGLVKLVEELEG